MKVFFLFALIGASVAFWDSERRVGVRSRHEDSFTYPVALPKVHSRSNIGHLFSRDQPADIALHVADKFFVNTEKGGMGSGEKYAFPPAVALKKYRDYLDLLRDEKLATSDYHNFQSVENGYLRGELEAWRRFTDAAKNIPELEKVTRANNWLNHHTRYVGDKAGDTWSPFLHFFVKGGDCEDFALAKMETLKEMGVPESQLHVGIGMVPKYGAHAVLLYDTPDGKTTYILDNLNKKLRTSTADPIKMSFIFSFNSKEMVTYR